MKKWANLLVFRGYLMLWVKSCHSMTLRWMPQPLYLWMWPCLEVGSLQMRLPGRRTGPDMILREWETWTRRWMCTQREGHEKREAQMRGGSTGPGMPEMPANPQKLGRGLDQFFPQDCWREPRLLTPWYWTSSLQNREAVNFRYLSPPV